MTEQLSTTPSADAETVPATMTAIVQRGYGGPEVLHREEIEVPAPDAGQVLLRVAAAGLDRGVWHLMAGLPYLVRPMFGMSTPRQPIPGLDVAGTVVALGPGAEATVSSASRPGVSRSTPLRPRLLSPTCPMG